MSFYRRQRATEIRKKISVLNVIVSSLEYELTMMAVAVVVLFGYSGFFEKFMRVVIVSALPTLKGLKLRYDNDGGVHNKHTPSCTIRNANLSLV